MPDFADVLKFGTPQEHISATKNPPVSFHFMVSFLMGGVFPNPLDIGFQTVSGISAEIETDELREGGENIHMQRLPTRVVYENLILERGMVIGSFLNQDFNVAMTSLRFVPSNVLVILLSENNQPLSAWSFYRAYPVKWTISDLDANENGLVIETMELAYVRFQSMRI